MTNEKSIEESKIGILQSQVAELTQWKAEQLAVEAAWEPQTVASALNLPLGSDIRAGILPAVEMLKSDIAELVEALENLLDVVEYEDHTAVEIRASTAILARHTKAGKEGA